MKTIEITTTSDPDLWDVPQLAHRWGCAQSFIWAQIAGGRLKAVKMGRRTKITQSAKEEYERSLPPARAQAAA